MAANDLRAPDVTALGLSTGAAVVWRTLGELRVTVVVKATFALTPGGAMRPVRPEAIVRAEVHHGNNPVRSVRLTSDLAPYLPRADVVLTGHACAPAGQEARAVAVRLAVFREQPVLEKIVHARGEIRGGEPAPFERIPLVYERAHGGIGYDENPLGVGAGPSPGGAPSLVHPSDPQRVACFAPISRSWPARRRLLGSADRKALDREIAEVPAGFDWAYYHAAPPDQRVDYLHGDEWIIVDGVSATHPHVASYLPRARGLARVYGLDPGEARPVAMVADTLRIDGDALLCTVVWRGSLLVPEERLGAIRILCALECQGQSIAWPAPGSLASQRPPGPAPPPPRGSDHAETLMLEGGPARGAPADEIEDVSDLARTMATGDLDDEDAPRAPEAPEGGRPFCSTITMSDDARPAAEPLPFRAGPPAPEIATPPSRRSPPRSRDGDPGARTTITLDAGGFEEPPPPSLPFRRPPPPPALEARAPAPAAPAPPSAPPPQRAAAPAAKRRPRTAEGIELFNDTGLVFDAIPWRLSPPRDCFTVIAKATCDLVPGAPAAPRREAEPLSGEILDERGAGAAHPSDLALYKVRADVVLTGHAWAPGGEAREAEVSFRFGHEGNAFERRVLVLGDRVWTRAGKLQKPSAPAPFHRMPLSYDRAFGGPGFDPNPIGVGLFDPMRPASRGPAPLPGLEDPAQRIRTPRQTPDPACFAPVPQAWRDRAARRNPRRGGSPLLPEDLDWTRFQAAPRAQQLAFLAGDEPFAIAGAHPHHPVIEGALPGIRARCFAVRKGRVEEIPMRLDTVAFDLDALKITLVWRGAAGVADERAPDLTALHLFTEDATTEGMTLTEARDRLLRP
ncbi:MAG: DUF2169 domain-containing protein [Polyangiaceae bacterium]|nr:DUF2169 domain-containing protein [Polyangiaceae bacterium]